MEVSGNGPSGRVEQIVEQAVAAIRKGEVEAAQKHLAKALSIDPNHEQAWLWLSGTIEQESERRYCLEKVLSINPENTMAKKGMARLSLVKSQRPAVVKDLSAAPKKPSSSANGVPVVEKEGDELPEPPLAALPDLTPGDLNGDEEEEEERESPIQRLLATITSLPSRLKKRPKKAKKDDDDDDELAEEIDDDLVDEVMEDEEDEEDGRPFVVTDDEVDDIDDDIEDDDDEALDDEVAGKRKKMLLAGFAIIVVAAFAVIGGLFFLSDAKLPFLPGGDTSSTAGTVPITGTTPITTAGATTPITTPLTTGDGSAPAGTPPGTGEFTPTDTITPTATPYEPPVLEEPTPTLPAEVPPLDETSPLVQRFTDEVRTGFVANGGNMRSSQRIAPDTVIGQICPGDQVEILAEQGGWYQFRITQLAADCHPNRVPLNTEGWASGTLVNEATFQPDELYPSMPSGLLPALFNGVVDGNTLDVTLSGDGTNTLVWFAGVDAPVAGAGGVECFGPEATEGLRALVQDASFVLYQEVTNEAGENQGYYVWLPNQQFLNYEMAQQGYAHVQSESPHTYQELLERAEIEARINQRGLWSPETCDGQR